MIKKQQHMVPKKFLIAQLHRKSTLSIDQHERAYPLVKSKQPHRHNYWLLIFLHISICRTLTGVRCRMIRIDLVVVWEELYPCCKGENTSCLLADGTEMCCTGSSGRQDVLRTQHLQSLRVKPYEAEEGMEHPTTSPVI